MDMKAIDRITKVITCISNSKHVSYKNLKMTKEERLSYMNGLLNFISITLYIFFGVHSLRTALFYNIITFLL